VLIKVAISKVLGLNNQTFITAVRQNPFNAALLAGGQPLLREHATPIN
jgi:hypothetical protein